DTRYAALQGASVELPLTGRRIPLITDDYVDRAFGTGVVKVTPAHDFNDYAVGQRHGLPMINIFDSAARVIDDGSWTERVSRQSPVSQARSNLIDLATDAGIPEE